MFKFFNALLFLISLPAYSQALEFSFSYEAYLFGEQRKYSDSVINSGNEILKIPETSVFLDQRAEFKWLINDAKIILRPRIVSYQQEYQTVSAKTRESVSDTHINLTDVFYEQYLTDRVFTTVGLQVYQWGGAEILNPSNPFFHFSTEQKSIVYKEKGKVLLRLNWNAKADNTFVLMAEPVSNNESYWIAEEAFEPQIAGKFETAWTGTRNFLGFVLGIPDNADFFVGEYFQYEFIEGISVYADAKHSMNTFFYEPQVQGNFQRMLPSEQNGVTSTLAVAGFRYEDVFDIRLEYIYNSSGYDQKKFDNALIASSQISPFLVDNLKRFQRSGLELISQNYMYLSARKTDFLQIKDLSLYLRSLTSLMDYSGVEQIEFDKSALDWMTFFGQVSVFRGDMDSEFKITDDWKASLGIKAVY